MFCLEKVVARTAPRGGLEIRRSRRGERGVWEVVSKRGFGYLIRGAL